MFRFLNPALLLIDLFFSCWPRSFLTCMQVFGSRKTSNSSTSALGSFTLF
ncbi:hypothetical protein M758_6G048200 [Ceratodon purpureus]|nr:hypothetical protein M758_6G048200 [Ceratodon purpureus]